MHLWYAIRTKSRQEEVAEASLRMIGVETFNPKLMQKARLFGSRVTVVRPLFLNYLFARFDVSIDYRRVRYARGVQRIVEFGGGPAPVDEAIITLIADRTSPNGCVVLERGLRPGDAVKVVDGPLAGLAGILEAEMSDSERVVVLLNAISYQARALVERERLQRITGDGVAA